MVPYSNFMTMERVYGPSQITRYNLFTSAMITGEQAPGVSSGEALEAVEEIAAEVLPRGYDIEWSGVAREEKESGGQSLVIFAICLVFVYLLLAAQLSSRFRQVCSDHSFYYMRWDWRIIFMLRWHS